MNMRDFRKFRDVYNKYNNRNIYICIEKLNKNNNLFFG